MVERIIPAGTNRNFRVSSSVAERCPDKTEAGGSIPPSPTRTELPNFR